MAGHKYDTNGLTLKELNRSYNTNHMIITFNDEVTVSKARYIGQRLKSGMGLKTSGKIPLIKGELVYRDQDTSERELDKPLVLNLFKENDRLFLEVRSSPKPPRFVLNTFTKGGLKVFFNGLFENVDPKDIIIAGESWHWQSIQSLGHRLWDALYKYDLKGKPIYKEFINPLEEPHDNMEKPLPTVSELIELMQSNKGSCIITDSWHTSTQGKLGYPGYNNNKILSNLKVGEVPDSTVVLSVEAHEDGSEILVVDHCPATLKWCCG